MNRTALVTGITGQDGSYLAELLLSKGYEVHGIVRRSSSVNSARIDHLCHEERLHLHYGDLADSAALSRLMGQVAPDEVYNLGAQSHVKVSWDQAEYTADVTGLGVLRLLEAARDAQERLGKQIRFYQASSSEMFGAAAPPQSLSTPFHPRSPYACAKVYGFWQTVNHRESYDLFACNGILFNHESPRRGETFVTRKITRAVGRIKEGLQDKLYLGNLDAKRDWGHARDYVEAMWLMMQHEQARDYVVATGEAYSVREFAERAFALVGLDAEEFIEVDARFFRPAEVDYLLGDPQDTFDTLGWELRTSFEELVREMVEADLELAQREKLLRDAGKPLALAGAGNL
ncbi:GDPmannose 4,6-dehydratase [Abditibacterium utsteinense]|uniref:GDP-mannose 4,6-dehydratase n=1 Tax=Abditibacterium utsteinense TaxID=1960156 RepID=A0A2S8SNV9_9BACT|nr:GDP-mannose 4,6-dehydratase [Abditibacterium utsteinense]PQV62485.1 GDPmannose 4,6-dehydratase [Abditibacterium utsteinense]